jgi:hypothetical protein
MSVSALGLDDHRQSRRDLDVTEGDCDSGQSFECLDRAGNVADRRSDPEGSQMIVAGSPRRSVGQPRPTEEVQACEHSFRVADRFVPGQ